MEFKNRYSLFMKIKLAYWLIRTKLICRSARIFRFPLEIRGRKYINFGHSLTTGVGCRLEVYSEDGKSEMNFGQNVQINDYVHICAMKSVTIGDNVLMASHIYISDNSHGFYKGNEFDTNPNVPPQERDYYVSSVEIGDNVWIGEHVVVMPGVTIGKGAVIGANSVVTRDIPNYTIAVGQPAKPIKEYDFAINKWISLKL